MKAMIEAELAKVESSIQELNELLEQNKNSFSMSSYFRGQLLVNYDFRLFLTELLLKVKK